MKLSNQVLKMLGSFNELRNKTIEELKKEILLNYSHLKKISIRKDSLIKIKKNKVAGPIEMIFNRIFNRKEETEEEIEKCTWDEETVKENINRLEQEKRMKELATVNEWWKANEEIILSKVPKNEQKRFKQEIFKVLVQELEKDEVSFIQTADQILFRLSR